MNIRPLYTRQESTDDGVVVQTSWGYCRQQNAVRFEVTPPPNWFEEE